MKLKFVSNELINTFISLNNKETTMKHLGFGNSWDNVEEYASMFPVAHDKETGRVLDVEDFYSMSIDQLVMSQERDNSSNVTGFVKEATDWHDEATGERELGKAELCDWSSDGELTVYEPDFCEQELSSGPMFYSKEEFVQVQNAQRLLNFSNYMLKLEEAKTDQDLRKITFELLGGDKVVELPSGIKKVIHVIGYCSKENPRGVYFFCSGGLTLFWEAYRAKKAELANTAAKKIESIFMEYVNIIATAKHAGELKKLNQAVYADNRLPYSAKTELWNTSKERIARMA